MSVDMVECVRYVQLENSLTSWLVAMKQIACYGVESFYLRRLTGILPAGVAFRYVKTDWELPDERFVGL